MSTTFKWDSAALTREKTEPIDLLGDGEMTIFYELPRGATLELLKAANEKEGLTEKKEQDKIDVDGNPTGEKEAVEVRVPFYKAEEVQRRRLVPFLSLSTKPNAHAEPTRSEAFFLDDTLLTANQFGLLIDMLFKINHTSDILSAGGNWALLPLVYQVDEEAEAAKTTP